MMVENSGRRPASILVVVPVVDLVYMILNHMQCRRRRIALRSQTITLRPHIGWKIFTACVIARRDVMNVYIQIFADFVFMGHGCGAKGW